ncbi:hypothetical protein MMC17_004743 [Xylographa soralifera]|nr:hypothetical protein [Xylographa soralifera]
MSGGKKGKKAGSRSETTPKSKGRAARETIKKMGKRASYKPKQDLIVVPAPRLDARTGIRSRSPTKALQPIVGNPEDILRKARKLQRDSKQALTQERVDSFKRGQLHIVAKSIEVVPREEHQHTDYIVPARNADDEASSELDEDTDLEQTFNRKWGYLPPLDEEVAAIIDAIIENPDMASQYKRTSPDQPQFMDGLTYRNVILDESSTPDPQADRIRFLIPAESAPETSEERQSYGQLWNLDQAKCNETSNEALFQRTLMMSLISRHSFIYDKDIANRCCLDFCVEELWTCPPMPTRAYVKNAKFLTMPKPDLAVCFRRKALIPNNLWNKMPHATRRLACYEKLSNIGDSRVFHFFTIEAKKEKLSPDDNVGKRQSLNNASQALHNMFEFFKDADNPGDTKFVDIFFDQVRFFTVVASTEGLTIRIHRATREDGTGEGFIMEDHPEYPLRFEYQEFCKIAKDNFDRATVSETFKRILIGYGAEELRILLRDAAQAVMNNLAGEHEKMKAREKPEFYRYGQTIVAPESRIPTPSRTPGPLLRTSMSFVLQQDDVVEFAHGQAPSETNMSFDMTRSGTNTPRQSPMNPGDAVKGSRKRSGRQSEDMVPEKRTRGRK